MQQNNNYFWRREEVPSGVPLAGTYFDELKHSSFLTLTPEREPLFHYVIFCHSLPLGVSGVSRNNLHFARFHEGASDFVIAVGPESIRYPDGGGVPVVHAIAGTFMHELGHNLGLGHGGVREVAGEPVPLGVPGDQLTVVADHDNWKPTHLSVMNYSFQGGLIVGRKRGVVDYFRFEGLLPILSEADLNERQGIVASDLLREYQTWYFCSRLECGTPPSGGSQCDPTARGRKIRFNQKVDFDCRSGKQTSVCADVNRDCRFSLLIPSLNEWEHLVYTGGAIGKTGNSSCTLPACTAACQ